MENRFIGYIAAAGAFIVVAFVVVVNYYNLEVSSIFSIKNMLNTTWKNYTSEYVEAATGRVIDPSRNNVTTSEGVSYTMLRAVWIDDKDTFDKTFSWAKQTLQRKDKIFSWLFGKKTDGTYGVLTDQGGQNSASDADTNIALALVFAAKRWSDPSYLSAAQEIMRGIWEQEVVTIQGVPYLAADDIEKKSNSGVIINPSYLEPYAYRIFASVDTTHPWTVLVGSSYDILEKSTHIADGSNVGKMPPDWITIDQKTGALVPNESSGLSSAYSYDALRIPWNIAMDYEWFKEPRAKQYLSTLDTLGTSWDKNQKLFSAYGHNGTPVSSTEIPAMYGGGIGYFIVERPWTADRVYRDKILSNFNQDANTWVKPLSYYDDNWIWFGIALYNHLLPNLAAQST